MTRSEKDNPRESKTRIRADISENPRTKKKPKSEYTGKANRKLIIDTNRRLQETMQQLFMAKQELEKKNKELEKARQREHEQKEHLQRELNILKHLAGAKVDDKSLKNREDIPEKKLTKSIAEDLSLRYIHLLESYAKTKDLDKDESLVKELCLKLIEFGVTPKGIISIHLKAVMQIKTIGDMETKRVTFESRMVLLKVMTQYASLLLKERRP